MQRRKTRGATSSVKVGGRSCARRTTALEISSGEEAGPREPLATKSRPTKPAPTRRTTARGRSPGEVRNIASNSLCAWRANGSAGQKIRQGVGQIALRRHGTLEAK